MKKMAVICIFLVLAVLIPNLELLAQNAPPLYRGSNSKGNSNVYGVQKGALEKSFAGHGDTFKKDSFENGKKTKEVEKRPSPQKEPPVGLDNLPEPGARSAAPKQTPGTWEEF